MRRSAWTRRRQLRRGSATVEFALLLVLQLFFLLVVIQFMIICVADSINTYSSFIGARAQAVHKSPQLASAFWVMRVYRAPMWRIPPWVTSPDESSVVSRYSVPLEMAWASGAINPTRRFTVEARTRVYREERGDSGDNATMDGY